MEENGRKRKETARIQHVGRDNQTSAKQIKVERSRSWHNVKTIFGVIYSWHKDTHV
jgi:hypothetical protein